MPLGFFANHLCNRATRSSRNQNWARAGSAALVLAIVFCDLAIAVAQDSAPATEETATAESPESEAAAEKVDFNRQIRPLLARRCYSCHGPDGEEAGLQLHQYESATAETYSGTFAIVAGKPEDSEMLARIVSDDPDMRMPPEGKPLTEAEVDLLRRWIAGGAEYQQHWAFQPITNPPLPEVKNRDWLNNGIDNFVLAGLESHNLKPADKASRRTLVRRVYFDLLGVPPTPEEAQAFCEDESELAYAELVDRLLDDKRYGERWARHWLDVVRYAETNSYERDGAKPNAWRYRDYVIKSFNSDKPYDQFIREQLAGDELDEVTAETLTATGYYRLGIWDDEPADPLQARFDGFDDIITTTAQGMLGLTVNCARCHDHKIDPIPQADYYRLVAFFGDVTPYGDRGNQSENSQIPISPPELAQQYSDLAAKLDSLRNDIHNLEQKVILRMKGEDQRATEGRQRRKTLQEKFDEFATEAEQHKYEELKKEQRQTQKERDNLPPQESILGLAKCDPRPEPAHILMRGSPHAPGDEVSPGFLAIFGTSDPEIPEPAADAKTAGRRRVLADWITSKDNWLTARVIVNRLWQHHFGRGIVRSSNNFGEMGDRPTHPELLDFLATELMRNDWHMKPIHRLMMLSQTYQMSSQATSHELAEDPGNDYFWRYNMRRLSAEEIRDTSLAVSGQLNGESFGPSIFPTLSAEVLSGQSVPGKGWSPSSPEQQRRRSIYIHIKRSLIPPVLANFDFPEPDLTCEGRFLTTQPAQALGMLNGDFQQEQAFALAKRVASEAGLEFENQIRRAIELAFVRPATDEDITISKKLYEDLQREYSISAEQALGYCCLALMNQNEFIYLD